MICRRLLSAVCMLFWMNSFAQEDTTLTTNLINYPQFMGEKQDLVSHFQREIQFPDSLNVLSDSIIVSFTVNGMGGIQDVQIENLVIKEIDESLVKAVDQMPFWFPAHEDNYQPVRIRGKLLIVVRNTEIVDVNALENLVIISD